MEMTFDQYTVNPMGIQNRVYSYRELYRNLYKEKLDKILVREAGHVDYKLYKNGKDYIIHFKIPSEVVPNFYYDTVIQFYTDKLAEENSASLKNYYVKFYSNDPSFVFTFAHAMIKNNLFIKDLTPKMSKLAVKKVAVERNPKKEIGYVKSIYFAYLIMRLHGLFNKIKFDDYAEKYDKKKLLASIEHADKKIEDRQELGKKVEKEKRRKTAKTNTTKNTNNFKISKNSSNTNIKRTKSTKSIGNVSTIKKSKTIKK